MSVTITKMGMPNQSMRLERDTAEVLLEALAQALGASVMFDCQPTEDDVEAGSIAVQVRP